MLDSLGWDSGLDFGFNASGDFNVLEQRFSNANEHQNHMEGLSKHRLLPRAPKRLWFRNSGDGAQELASL